MNTDLATVENLPAVELNLEDVKKYIAPGATDKELFMFMNICRSYGLNPFRREVHFVKYGSNPGQTIVGYEAYIKRAERTGLLDGWDMELGKDELGQRATITIYRKDRKNPFRWTVYKDEFDSGQANWKKMPLFMLRKVAISQGFRLAFPEELGGLPYIPEELDGHVSEKLPQDAPNMECEPDDDPGQYEDNAVPNAALKAYEAIVGDYKGISTAAGLKNHPKACAELYAIIAGTPYQHQARQAYKDRLEELKA